MSFDPLVTNAGRLRILTELAVEERQEFVDLRRRTRLTDGNLAAHGKRLRSGGLIEIDKQFRDGKPVTTYLLTPAGRQALEAHARRLLAAISQRRKPHDGAPSPASAAGAGAEVLPPPVEVFAAPADDDWVD